MNIPKEKIDSSTDNKLSRIIEDLAFPEMGSDSATTPFDSIQPMNQKNTNLHDFPFSMGEIFQNISTIRKLPKSYFVKMQKIRKDAAEYREKYIIPNIDEIEKKASLDPGYFPHDIMKEAAKYRFFSLIIPEGFGGPGYMTAHVGIMAEELAVGCGGFATSLAANLTQIIASMDPYLLSLYCHESVQAEKKGKPIFWSIAVTEPNAGTDRLDKDFFNYTKADMVAKKVKGGYLLKGSKCFISNGSVAQRVAMSAALDPGDYNGTGCFFIIKTDSPGFSVGRIERKGGQKSSKTAELVCRDVFVPDSHKINVDGVVANCINLGLCASRGPVGAIGVGCGRRALEALVKWAMENKNGRGRLIDQQALQMRIANMARELVIARSAYIQSGIAFDEIMSRLVSPWYYKMVIAMTARFGMKSELSRRIVQTNFSRRLVYGFMNRFFTEDKLKYVGGLANIAKITGSSTGRRIAGEAMAIMGADAALPKWGVDRAFRDARLTEIYEGTNEACAITAFKAMAASFSETLKSNGR